MRSVLHARRQKCRRRLRRLLAQIRHPLQQTLVPLVLLLDATAVAATVNFSELVDATVGTTYKVRDIWARKDLGSATGTYTTAPIGPHDSVLLLLTPQ